MSHTVRRVCTLCEANCGLSFEVEANRITAVRPDRDDPFSQGFVCPKGMAMPSYTSVLFLHPKDAAERRIGDGDEAVLESRVHRGPVRVRLTPDVAPGVVSLPHGWGHTAAARWQKTAGAHAGVSINDWTDEAEVESVVGQSILSGVPVRLEARA